MNQDQFQLYTRLNKFTLTEPEAVQIKENIDWQLQKLAPLIALDCDDAAPMIYAVPLRQMFREDQIEQTITRDELLHSAVETQDGAYVVPRVAD